MVGKLFGAHEPRAADMLLDPGCGTGAFIEGVLRWCNRRGCSIPRIVGIDSDPDLLPQARQRLGYCDQVDLAEALAGLSQEIWIGVKPDDSGNGAPAPVAPPQHA